MKNSLPEDPSLFLQFFGDTPKFRIIDFLLEHRLEDFTKTDIAKGAGVSPVSLFNHWGVLEKNGIVKVTRTIGRVRLFQLNEKSHVVAQLKSMELALIRQAADSEEEKAVMRVKSRASFSPHPI